MSTSERAVSARKASAASCVIQSFASKAFILETPYDKEGDDRRNLEALKRLSRPGRDEKMPARYLTTRCVRSFSFSRQI